MKGEHLGRKVDESTGGEIDLAWRGSQVLCAALAVTPKVLVDTTAQWLARIITGLACRDGDPNAGNAANSTHKNLTGSKLTLLAMHVDCFDCFES